MSLFLGIDGGGTRTRALLVDSSGQVFGWGEAGLTNPHHATREQVHTHLEEAIRSACRQAGSAPKACLSTFLGMAGVTTEEGRLELRRHLENCGLQQSMLGVDHDIRIALAGGLVGRPGIALIVGTGSSCYGRDAQGRTWQTGGWESLILDEGSAYYLGREAIAAAARSADGREPETPLREAVFRWLGISSISELPVRVHTQGLTRTEIAAFAPTVIRMAEANEPAATRIVDQGALLLAELVAANHRCLPTGPGPEVTITGGLGTADTLYRRKIHAAIVAQLPAAILQPPTFPPVVGAVLLAMEQAGAAPGVELLKRLGTIAA
jgi:N-acetylglucosamine kinase-like BadF-type ATPase